MIKVAICDDDNLFAHQLENIILSTCDKESIKVDTEIYLSGFTLEKGILTGQKIDLIFKWKMEMVFPQLKIFVKWMIMS